MTPFSTREITKENEYFGRDHIIKHLTSFANMGLNKEIIGLRRSGKTSLLRIMEEKLKQGKSVYPVFFDFKDAGAKIIKGTQSVYRYMIACLIAGFCEEGITNGDYTVRGFTIKPSSQWEDIYEDLSEISQPKTIGMFEELIESCAKEIKRSILFLIDEYECLFKDRFDQPEGFVPMRNLSQQTTPEGNKLFSFWIAGAVDWVEMCTSTGSPQLNVVDSPTIFLGSIDRESFHAMWNYEINFCQDEEKKRFLSGKEEMAFVLSGGFPFFGKQIGSHLLTSGNDPDNTFFDNHFRDMMKVLNESEQQCLGMLAKNNQDCSSSDVSDRLEYTGLIKNQGQKYEINIPYLTVFLNSIDTASADDNYPESYKIADEAEDYYRLINKNCENNSKPPVFKLVPQSSEYWKDIRKPCASRDDFGKFIRSLWRLLNETTRDEDPNGKIGSLGRTYIFRLPNSFRNSKFMEIVNVLRHTLGEAHTKGAIRTSKNKISYEKALEKLLGSKNEPYKEEEFRRLQIEVLKLFREAMNKLHQIVKSGNF